MINKNKLNNNNNNNSQDEDLSKYTLHAKRDIDQDDKEELGLGNDLYAIYSEIDEDSDRDLFSLSKTNRNKKSSIVINRDDANHQVGESFYSEQLIADPKPNKVNSGEEFLKLLNSKVARDKANLAQNNNLHKQNIEQVQETIKQTIKNFDKDLIRTKLKPIKNFDKQNQNIAFESDYGEEFIEDKENPISFKNSYKQSTSKAKSSSISFKNTFETRQLSPNQLVNLKSIIESTLYLAGEIGVSMHDLKRTSQLESNEIKLILNELQKDYDQQESGVLLVQFGDKFKIITQSKNKEALSRFVTSSQKNPLNQRLLETLSIIAYNQPTTRGFIESIRDKDPKPAIDSLLKLGLIIEAGHAKTLGHPILYVVTQKFYDMFGVRTISELPKLNKEIKDFNPLEE